MGGRLDDYILAHQPPPPPEEGEEELSDEERLDEMAQGYADLDREVSQRSYTGEGYDDGVSFNQLKKWRDKAEKAFRMELRRQQAQFTVGLKEERPNPIYDDY